MSIKKLKKLLLETHIYFVIINKFSMDSIDDKKSNDIVVITNIILTNNPASEKTVIIRLLADMNDDTFLKLWSNSQFLDQNIVKIVHSRCRKYFVKHFNRLIDYDGFVSCINKQMLKEVSRKKNLLTDLQLLQLIYRVSLFDHCIETCKKIAKKINFGNISLDDFKKYVSNVSKFLGEGQYTDMLIRVAQKDADVKFSKYTSEFVCSEEPKKYKTTTKFFVGDPNETHNGFRKIKASEVDMNLINEIHNEFIYNHIELLSYIDLWERRALTFDNKIVIVKNNTFFIDQRGSEKRLTLVIENAQNSPKLGDITLFTFTGGKSVTLFVKF